VGRCLDRQPLQPHDPFPGQSIRETPAHCKISTARKMKTEAPPAVIHNGLFSGRPRVDRNNKKIPSKIGDFHAITDDTY
jgi:hypothetical protein